MQKIVCPECGAIYSRVRTQSRINRSYCKYQVMLAISQTTQSITDHRDEGSYETIYNEAYKR